MNIVYIGRSDCPSCRRILRDSVEPLQKRYPNNVSIHMGFDTKISQIDQRQQITKIPLVVLENDGKEIERRLNNLDYESLERVILEH